MLTTSTFTYPELEPKNQKSEYKRHSKLASRFRHLCLNIYHYPIKRKAIERIKRWCFKHFMIDIINDGFEAEISDFTV